MKILRAFLLTLITLILLAVAFNFAASAVWGLPVQPVAHWLTRWIPSETLERPIIWRTLWGLAGLLVIAVWVLSVLIWRRRSRPLQVRAADGETVLIHPGALLKFIRIQVESHPAVISQRVRVRQRPNGGIGARVEASVQPVESLPNIKRHLEERIRNGFTKVLGIERLDELTIIIGLDEKTMNHRPGPVGRPEARPEPPVRGSLDLKAPAAEPAEEPPITPPPTPAKELIPTSATPGWYEEPVEIESPNNEEKAARSNSEDERKDL